MKVKANGKLKVLLLGFDIMSQLEKRGNVIKKMAFVFSFNEITAVVPPS